MTRHAIKKLRQKAMREMRRLEKQILRKERSGTEKALRQVEKKMTVLCKLVDDFNRAFNAGGPTSATTA